MKSSLLALVVYLQGVRSFTAPKPRVRAHVPLDASSRSLDNGEDDFVERSNWNRRQMFLAGLSMTGSLAFLPAPSHADKSFAPGGTLVDYEVGATVGNPEASSSRKFDNSNCLFVQDYYYKFGTAAPWIPEGGTDFPKTMPFTTSQQRYDALKKYRERVQRGLDLLANMKGSVESGDYASIADSTAPEYSLRPMGLLANSFLASENTGTTNELLLARWYINEVLLDIDDVKNAPSKEQAMKSYAALSNAVNSYLGLLNRVMTAKVGEKFTLI